MDRLYCPQCGAQSPGTSKFCFRCGHSFREVLDVAPMPPATLAPDGAPLAPFGEAIPIARPFPRPTPSPAEPSAVVTRRQRRAARRRWRALAGGSLMIAGAVLMIASIFVGWYSIDVHTPSFSETLHFSPDGRVTVTSPGHSAAGSFASAGLNNTGGLYGDVEGLLVLGFLCAASGGGIGVGSAWRPPARRAAVILGVLGLAFALFGPFLLAVNQPMALRSDSPSTSGLGGSSSGAFENGSGPGSTFTGTSLSPSGSASWGPEPGWYLSLLAGLIVVGGSVLTLLAGPIGRGPGSPKGVPQPADHVWTLVPAPRPGAPSRPATPVAPSYWCPTCQIGFATSADLGTHRQDYHRAPRAET